MPKPQLTQEAIAFIIQIRDDPTTITTWQDISNMVKEKFNINVSLQGIAKSYHRNKGKINPSIFLTHRGKIQEFQKIDTNKSLTNQYSTPSLPKNNIIKKNLNNRNEYDTSYSDNLTSEDIEKLLNIN
ncbi:hypothetical protein MOMA_02650 [Moraxella macacae 0408225]|uniref:Uncharacterized protein n=1 Tax=Moraxella macacae 0408225 TaxID=1230338 RepID=L2F870_9GAMM|nr:hypothetical protein [Moraxella macacae]ELA09269.1 hypothetical protein MOMA_02650 [Moraxella macacae 0408225]